MRTPLVVALTVLASVPSSAKTFRAETADISLPVKRGWLFDPDEYKATPSIPMPGKKCVNRIWFDFLPGATPAYTRQLIDTESIDVTRAIRHWDERTQTSIVLAGHPASRLDLGEGRGRTVFFLAAAGGSLVVQVMSDGREDFDACAAHQEGAAAALVKLFFAPSVVAKASELSRTQQPPAVQAIEEVPRNLDECMAALDKRLKPDELEAMRATTEDKMGKYHRTLGAALRHTWGLQGGSPLARYFVGLGIRHPDDMSGIILTSFWRHLHGRPVELDKQVAWYQRWWALRRPPDAKPCADGRAAKPLFRLQADSPDGERVLHVFACEADDVYWVWELDRGWSTSDDKLTARIVTLRRAHPDGTLISAPLEPVAAEKKQP